MAIEITEKEIYPAEKKEPVIKIKPGGSWARVDFGELWIYRELLYFLAWRDIKVRYKQTALGVIWVLLQPILTTLIFTVLFARFAPTTGNGIPYPLFAFCGFVLWTFVSNAVTNAANSIIGNNSLITKVYFPRLMLPLAAIAASFFDLLLSVSLLLVGLLIFAHSISWTIIFAPAFVALLVLLTFGAGTILAALNVRFRDVRFILPFALQILLFASPVFYALDFLPERARLLWRLNPLAGILEGFRASIFGTQFDALEIAISVVITAILFVVALLVFRRMEDDFADLI